MDFSQENPNIFFFQLLIGQHSFTVRVVSLPEANLTVAELS